MSDTRSFAESSARLGAWDLSTRPIIAIAAVAPFVALAVIPEGYRTVFLVIDLVSWFVFLVDYTVRLMIWRKYASTGAGVFDVVIVVATFPWQLFAFLSGAEFLAVFRMARLVRLATATGVVPKTMALAKRFGALGIWILGASIFSALTVLNAEPVESGFDTFWDAIWWALVSFTTVGYGDLYPVTGIGRFAGVIMMLTGLAALGSVAAILGSALGVEDDAEVGAREDELLVQVRALRDEVSMLSEQMASVRQNGQASSE